MISVFRLKIVEDEKEREAVLDVIAGREEYYVNLFKNLKTPPKIAVKFEGNKPLTIRIIFDPVDGRRVAIDTQGYGTADSVMKHAFKKLRRVAKNHFVKVKKRHRI